MAFGWDDAGLAALLVGDYVYHRWFDEPPKPVPAKQVTLPRTDDGAPYPIFYGRTRVKSSIVAWADKPLFAALPEASDPTYHYFLSMMLVIGIPFQEGDQKLLAMWAGDTLFRQSPFNPTGYTPVGIADLVGDGSDFGVRYAGVQLDTIGLATEWPAAMFGAVEFMDGNDSQRLVDVGTGDPLTEAGRHMTQTVAATADPWGDLYGAINVTDVPGYRGFASVFLYNILDNVNGVLGADGHTLYHWCVGDVPSVPQLSFEMQSLPGSWWGPAQGVPVNEGDITRDAGDANPMDVLYDILAGTKGKLGINPLRIDTSTFITAAATLYSEGLGYSNTLDAGRNARDIVDEMMRYIDGTIYEDPRDGLIRVKLIRADYDPASLLTISPTTGGIEIKSFAAGGWTDIPNRMRVSFPDRSLDYNDNSGVTPDEANVLGQDGDVREIQIRFDMCRELATANALADRELAARCRPLIKCTAVVDRRYRLLVPGDVVILNWPEWQLSGAVMRVASVNRGSLEDGAVVLSLIQDYFYVWRGNPPSRVPGGLSLKTPGGFTH